MQIRDLFQAKFFSGTTRGEAFERAGFLLLLIYLLAGVIYSAVLSPVARFPDEKEYLRLSYYLVHGPGFSMDGVHITARRAPGYAFFLAGIRMVGGDFFSFRVAQFLLFGATIYLVYRLGSEKKMFAGLLIVTCLVGCYPVLFYTAATLYPQTLSAFLFVLALTLLLVARRGLIVNLATGFSFGALVLDVPTFLLTMIVVLGVTRFYKMIRWRDVLVIFIAASLIIGTWTTRNALCFHRFVPLTSNSGLNLLEGNNPQATPFAAASNAVMGSYYKQADDLGLDEFQCDYFYRQAALTWIKTHPGQAFVLYLGKVLNFFNVVNVYTNQIHAEVSPGKQLVMAIGYLLLIGLLCWRLAGFKRFPLVPREKLFLTVYILSAFTSAIFFTRIRHRLPYDYLIIAIVALDLSRRLERWASSGQATNGPLPASSTKEGTHP